MSRKLRNTRQLTTGTLTPGTWCEGTAVGYTPTGRVAYRSTWTGYFVETRPSDWAPHELVHVFRDGDINGTRQTLHAFPADQLTQ